MAQNIKTHVAGTTLGYSTTQGGTQTVIDDLKSITPPGYPKAKVDVTSLDSPNKTRELIKGWKTPGDAKFVCWVHKTQLDTLMTMQDDSVIYWWRITFPLIGSEATNSKYEFQASVQDVNLQEVSTEGDDVWQVEIGLTATAAPDFTAGS